jgi:phage recombination protein Bet
MTQLGLIDRTGYNGRSLPDAPAGVIESFLAQCQRTRLDPMARQIYCIERGGKWGVQISIDGFRLIAERSKGYRGQTPAQWTADGREWLDVWLADGPPAAARVGVYREGFDAPQFSVATFAGYCPRDRDGQLAPKNQWLTNPSNQLAKCAEMLALRKAFPNELSGLYGTEEMDQAAPAASRPAADVPVSADARRASMQGDNPPTVAEVRAPSKDWLALANAAKSRAELRPVFNDAAAAGDLDIAIADGRTLKEYLWALREQLPEEAPAAEDVVVAEVVEDGEPVNEWPTATIPNGDAA